MFGAVLLGGLAMASHNSAKVPARMAWGAALGALAAAVSSVSIVDATGGNGLGNLSFVGFIVFSLSVLISSVMMLRVDEPAATPSSSF